ncbi:unnamed protein product, partial [Adineta ricciae]
AVNLLNDLRSKKHILAWQFDKMMPKRENAQLAYLYFVPKPHKEGTPLRPIVSSMHMPTTGISKFLDRLLRPLFDKHVRSTTIIDGVDLIRRLQAYTANGYLKPTTYLCTFDITDLYTMLPQEESLDILTEFLLEHGYTKVNAVPIDAIRKLARLVHTENVFSYEKRFYRQVVGGAMGSAFTLTLANVFMWKWEKRLVQQQVNTNENYGRHVQYIDDIFFTSNQPLNKINEMLDNGNDFHPNIKLVRQIGKNVSFLDVFIANDHGTLKTCVYHKEAAEPYTVPFNSDHPHHTFRNVIGTALLRAVRYSSTLSTFQKEQRTIKLMLLYMNYTPRFIYSRFHSFITIHAKTSNIQPFIHDENEFRAIRQKMLNIPTIPEYRMTSRIESDNVTSDPESMETSVLKTKSTKSSK